VASHDVAALALARPLRSCNKNFAHHGEQVSSRCSPHRKLPSAINP